MSDISFSVVIPLYNKEKSIANTIKSVLNQTYQSFELIIVNDGSTDNSLKVAQSIRDERIKIVNKVNGGVSSARNRGIKEAEYEWIAFLDGDDEWLQDFLENIVLLIQKYNECRVHCTRFTQSQDLMETPLIKDRIIADFYHESMQFRIIHSSSIVVKKSCFSEVGYFNEMLTHGEDLDMWSRLAKNYKIALCEKICSIYKLDAENRACKNLPIYEKHFMSQIDLKNMYGAEKKYNLKLLTIFFFEYLNMGNTSVPKTMIKIHNMQLLKSIIKHIFSALIRRLNRFFKFNPIVR